MHVNYLCNIIEQYIEHYCTRNVWYMTKKTVDVRYVIFVLLVIYEKHVNKQAFCKPSESFTNGNLHRISAQIAHNTLYAHRMPWNKNH